MSLFSFIYYSSNINRQLKYLNKHYNYNKKNINVIKIKISEDYSKRNELYIFLQNFGPAMGFIFTVSSLIVGLNPEVHSTRNIELFFKSIQIAMVSTFIGLLLRIIALFLQKYNDKIFHNINNIFLLKKNV